jgi:hypothetical protein
MGILWRTSELLSDRTRLGWRYSRLHWNVHSRKTRKLFCGADGMTMASGSVIRLASVTLADCGSESKLTSRGCTCARFEAILMYF